VKFIYEDERIPHFIVTERAMGDYSPSGKATAPEWRRSKIVSNKGIDFDLVKRWINLCKNEHGAACDRPDRGKSPAKRLIDVEKNCIVDGADVDEYFTLSYVWGTAAQFMLIKDVVQDSMKEGFFSDIGTKIPQSIRDAMQVCRNIGVRYLWVDALCIIQDDDQDKGDQIMLMDEIYGHALAVLVVAAGESAEHGIPGMGERTRALVNCEEAVDGKILMTSLASTTNSAKLSHWNTRAWTYQEYILGNRLLVFTETYVFFRCAQTIFRDGEVLSDTGEPFPVPAQSGDDWISVTAQAPEDMDPKEIWKQYYDGLLAFYLRRNMKFDTDSLPAFSGVLKVLSKRLGPFHHGLPKKYFARSLLWNDAHHGIFDRRACFPSWSWAGWKWKFEFFDSQKSTVGAYGYNMPTESVPMQFFVFDGEGKLQPFFLEGPEVAVEEDSKSSLGTNDLMDWMMMANEQVQAHPDLSPMELTMKLLGSQMRKQKLGQTQSSAESEEHGKECKARLMAQLEPPEDYTEVNCKDVVSRHPYPEHLLAFYTSVAYLKVPFSADQEVEEGSALNYEVLDCDGQRLFNCWIDPAWREKQPEYLEFVVIGLKETGRSVALILLEEVDGVHYRVNWNWKLSQHVEIKDWMALDPVRKLVIWG
jgi:hypothetical protein